MGVVRDEDLPIEARTLTEEDAAGSPEQTENAGTGDDGPEGEVEDAGDNVKLPELPEDEAEPKTYTPPPKRATASGQSAAKPRTSRR